MYIEVVVNVPRVSGVFDYHVPDHLKNQVKPGCLVEVPFGKQMIQGIVLREVEIPQVPDTRPINSLVDPQPVVTPQQIRLAQWMAEATFSSLSACMGLMIPPGLRQQADTLFQRLEGSHQQDGTAAEGLSPFQKQLLEHISKPVYRKSGVRGRQLDAAFRHADWRKSARFLESKGWISTRSILAPPSARPKTARTVQLACAPHEMGDNLDVGRGAAGERRAKILEFLKQEPWPVEISWVYAASGGNLADVQKLAEAGLVILGETEVWRDPLEDIAWLPAEIPNLSFDQQSVWKVVQDAIKKRETGHPFMLHGVTGSGKTEIYLRAVQETLEQGRQAIVLVPEIALTPQTVRRFLARFPGQVGLIHSRLSDGERYDTWRRARAGSLKVIIGARSALFAPLADPGLIVVDECHDDSYFQSDPLPYYHAVQAAIQYGKIADGVVLLGSATPPIQLLYQAKSENWPVLQMPQRILAHRESIKAQMDKLGLHAPEPATEGDCAVLPLPPVQIVDMREELKTGNRSLFSRPLQEAIQQTLANNQQAILFLNRRGKATFVFCRNCGYTLKCPRCDLPLTWHTLEDGQGILICHVCGYRRKMPSTCPQCGSTRIRQFGAGTEKVESELKDLFPEARVLRWDASTTTGKDAHEIILSHFANHRADILVGTQMLAKGLDLPLVTLVGVILAEAGLNFPDYRSGERAFQLLTQVAGRAGRSPLGGKVILQSFEPGHYAIQAASRHDYEGFYRTEIEYRKRTGYPPFSRLLRLEYRHAQPRQAEAAARSLANQLKIWLEAGDFRATEMIGPVPCYFGKLKGLYRWQILLRGPHPLQVIRGQTLEGWRVEVDPPSVL
ncbi:MAG: primosomal protein N' [Chloroflexi bacterium]|nr:primosomal protein N' [Chloroflexota bacterium]